MTERSDIEQRGRLSRRNILRSVGGALTATLAGCPSDGEGTTTGQPPSQTPTPAPTTTAAPPSTASSTTTTSTCPEGPIEPTESGESAELNHFRREIGTRLLEEAVSEFEAISGHSLTPERRVHSAAPGTKLHSEVPEDEGPHLFEVTHDRAATFDESGFLAREVPEGRVEPCQYVDVAWEAAHYDGNLVGLPVSGHTVALYYNRNIVDTPPETFEELLAMVETNHDSDSGQYGLTCPINPYFLSGFAQAYGTPIYDGEADELGVDSDDVRRGLALVFDRLRPYMPADPGVDRQRQVFENGDAAFHINGPWELPRFRHADLEYGVATLPSLPAGGTPRPYTGIELWYYMVKMDKDPDGAVAGREFAEWFTTSQERLLAQAERTDRIPVYGELFGDDRLPADLRSFSEQLQIGYPIPQHPKMNKVWGPFGDAVTEAFTSENPDLSNLLSTAEAEIREAWAER